MLHPNTFEFLTGLKNNNNKPWFEANRPAYEAAKKDTVRFIDTLIAGLAQVDAPVAEAGLQGKNCLMRLFRDVRFSADKSPYKTIFFAFLNPGGRKSNQAGYYLHLEPGGSFAGGGAYLPEAEDLARFRQEIDFNWAEWQALVANPAFAAHFPGGVQAPETLSRPPKGYTADNPALTYLKMKGFFTQQFLSDADLLAPDGAERVLESFRATQPLVHFLNRALA